MNYSSFKPFLQRLAAVSGDKILQYYGQPALAIDRKKDNSPVTIADKEAELVMRDLIRKTYPSHGIVGEEYGNENPHAEFVWLLDPIDGTLSFATGVPLFGTLIALLHQGQPVLGAIHQPVLKQFCMGDGQETTLNGKRVQMRQTMSIAEATVLSTCVKNVAKHQDERRFAALINQSYLFRTWGDAYGYLALATGWADVMCDPIMNPWDLGPLKPIIEGAGGVITDWQGNSIIGAKSCIAANRALHGEVLRILNDSSF